LNGLGWVIINFSFSSLVARAFLKNMSAMFSTKATVLCWVTEGAFKRKALHEFVSTNKLPLVIFYKRDTASLISDSAIRKQVRRLFCLLKIVGLPHYFINSLVRLVRLLIVCVALCFSGPVLC
jgi:hypothetical protein